MTNEEAIEIPYRPKAMKCTPSEIIDSYQMAAILDKIRTEIDQEYTKFRNKSDMWNERACGLGTALEIIDKVIKEVEE